MKKIYLNKNKSILLSVLIIIFCLPIFISSLFPLLITIAYQAYSEKFSIMVILIGSFFSVLYSLDSLYKIIKKEIQGEGIDSTKQIIWLVIFLIGLILGVIKFGPASIIFFDY